MTVRNKHHFGGHTPPHGVDIQRGTIFGNIFNKEVSKDVSLEKYEKYIIEKVQKDPEFRAAVLALDGKDLYCTCAPRRCHGHILEKIIFKMQMGEL